MNKLQQLIFNNGERLVPYVSHDESELIRHRSSYSFFHNVISSDLLSNPILELEISVADLGFGSGYGCALLSSVPNCHITGIDISEDCAIFARQYYPRKNVNYHIADLSQFIPTAEPFDYVVSRGVLEHVPDGLRLVHKIKFHRRMIIDVPYDEAPGNEHHVLTGIKEDVFSGFENCEIFYEDLQGAIFDSANKPAKPNMIMVVLSAPELPRIDSLFKFPLPPVCNKDLEILSEKKAIGNTYHFTSPVELLAAIKNSIKETEVVIDIGCGIVPMSFFRPKIHFMIEPWLEYSRILAYRYAGDKGVIIVQTGALEALKILSDNSVDSVFLLDVIEHLEKEEGKKVIAECERVAREQIVIFTPYGYMSQHMDKEQPDGWGLGGITVQEHRSGWEPQDFENTWSFYICNDFHATDFKGETLPRAHGAFYAVRNFENKAIAKPEKFDDIRRWLPVDRELEVLKNDYQTLNDSYQTLIGYRPIKWARKVLQTIRAIKAKMSSL